MTLLITGGAGYIGSHTCVELLQAGYDIIVADNLSNSKITAIDRVKQITKRDFRFYKMDLLDKQALDEIFNDNDIEGIVHFAGLKAVGESVNIPLKYYQNNIIGTLNLCEAMMKYDVNNFVFSSSATVYGEPASSPIYESFPLSATNPYGRTKLMIEQILTDLYNSSPKLNIAILRYFNPVGAHISGLIGEDPNGLPNNLVPYISQVAIGKLKALNVYGNDYPTKDGTGIRDYIHVVDLALGHIAALKKLNEKPGLLVYNLGTGKGYSVLDMVKAFSKACGKDIPYVFAPRRPGDIAECYANPMKAERELGWTAKRGIDEMCADTWRWQTDNPNGYE